MTAWRFPDPPNFEAFSTRGVMERGEPILLVTHEADDGAWQFIGDEWEEDELVLVCLEHVVAADPSVAHLADLPLGWGAERSAPGEPWSRYPLLSSEGETPTAED